MRVQSDRLDCDNAPQTADSGVLVFSSVWGGAGRQPKVDSGEGRISVRPSHSHFI